MTNPGDMLMEDGRALREPALVSDQAAARLDPTGFDPAREWFAATMFDALWVAFVGGDFEIEVQDLIEGAAVKAGLVVKVPFDPDIHTDSGACEPGGDYWMITDKGRQLIRMARDRDGAEGGDANAAPVPQDRQARAEGIAQPQVHP